jgi:hypothetical protein
MFVLCYAYVVWVFGAATVEKGAFYVVTITLGIVFAHRIEVWDGQTQRTRELKQLALRRERKENEEHRQMMAFLALPTNQQQQARAENWYPKAFPDRRSQHVNEAEKKIMGSSNVDFEVFLLAELAELRAITGRLNDVVYYVSGKAKREQDKSEAFLREMRVERERAEREWQALPLSEKQSGLEANLSQWATKGNDGVWRSNEDGAVVELNDDGTVKRDDSGRN